MVMKLMGSVMVVFASSSVGFAIVRSMRERIILLVRLQGLLQFLVTEIDFAVTFFPEALTKIGRSLGSEIEAFCEGVVDMLGAGAPLATAWERASFSFVNDGPLYVHDIQPLLSLAPVIGLTNRQDQLRHIKLAQEYLRQKQHYIEQEFNKNQKLWQYLGVLGGVVAALVLI
ncbi:MAG TPA: stage III sporulation protein AB [bacterium]|jgi:stage III sporulation protein AB|nr:stage III sporulation protein AB [bacterium]